jgi:hypothetical protein
MLSVIDNTPIFVRGYHLEMLCTNNPYYRQAYSEYLIKLFTDTGIDGLMCDDIIHYGQWRSCGCKYCRAEFLNKTGWVLPSADNTTFWGNYENPQFRAWVKFRYDSSSNMLKLVQDTIGKDKPLFSCCASTVLKALDNRGLGADALSKHSNIIMLEMCGDVSSEDGKDPLAYRVPDLLIHSAIAREKNIPCIGLGYGFCADNAMVIWGLNKLFGSSAWFSCLTGRMPEELPSDYMLPLESDLISESYQFEAKYPHLFEGESVVEGAIFFSSSTKRYYGDHPDDYEKCFTNLCISLYEKNYPFEVMTDLSKSLHYKKWIIPDAECLSSKERQLILDFIQNGGEVYCSGLLGGRNEIGDQESSLLKEFGINAELDDVYRPLDLDNFFADWRWPQSRTIPSELKIISAPDGIIDSWYYIKYKQGGFHWSSKRTNSDENSRNFVQKLNYTPRLSQVPDIFRWREFVSESSIMIHFISVGFKKIINPAVRCEKKNITDRLEYIAPVGEMLLHGNYREITLYSPDLREPMDITPGVTNVTRIPLNKIKRFFTLGLK